MVRISQSATRMGILVGMATVVTLGLMWSSELQTEESNVKTWRSLSVNITPNAKHGIQPGFTPMKNFTRTNTRIFYNRVPKCGSRSVQGVIRDLARRNNFRTKGSLEFFPFYLNETEQYREVSFVSSLPEYALYNRHLYFLDFEKFGVPQPTYINVIRDPVERTISNHFFTNTINNWTETFDDCVSQEMYRCVGIEATYYTIPFFCGHNPLCNTPSRKSLMLAKRNVENYYAVVGLTEDIPSFFQVAEHALPRHFEGATEIYSDIGKNEWHETATFSKGSASTSTRAQMAQLMKLDIEFYMYIKQRFYDAKRRYAANR